MQHIHMHMPSGQQQVFRSWDMATIVPVMYVTVNCDLQNRASRAGFAGWGEKVVTGHSGLTATVV
jgi:hypothetical protein